MYLDAPAKVEIHSIDKKLNNNVVKKIENLVLNYDNIFNLQNDQSEINLLNKKTLKNPSTRNS